MAWSLAPANKVIAFTALFLKLFLDPCSVVEYAVKRHKCAQILNILIKKIYPLPNNTL